MAAVSDKLGDMFQQDFPKRKRGTVGKGVKIILLTATGNMRETPTGDYER
jgi:hypothetical protein